MIGCHACLKWKAGCQHRRFTVTKPEILTTGAFFAERPFHDKRNRRADASKFRASDKVAAKRTASPRYSRLTIGATLVAPTGPVSESGYRRLATGSLRRI